MERGMVAIREICGGGFFLEPSYIQVISHLIWNLKILYRVHKNPPLVHILTQLDPVYIFKPILKLFNIYLCISEMVSSLHIFQLKFSIHFWFLPCVINITPYHSSLFYILMLIDKVYIFF